MKNDLRAQRNSRNLDATQTSFYDEELPQPFEKPLQQIMQKFYPAEDELSKFAEGYFANSPVMNRIKLAREKFLEKQLGLIDRRRTEDQIYTSQHQTQLQQLSQIHKTPLRGQSTEQVYFSFQKQNSSSSGGKNPVQIT